MISPITVKLPDLTTSETILPKVATGEPRAMSSCISKYGAMVWLITKGYVNNATEAEDLVQEIFTEVWKKAATFDPKIAAESTFIGLIARRRSIDFLRREGRKPSFEPLTVVDAFLQPTNEDTATIHDPDIVQSSVANLPPETRQLFQKKRAYHSAPLKHASGED